MQTAEIELKFPVSDPASFQSRLTALGFHLDTPRTFEHNTLFDTLSRDLRNSGQILRIRQYGPICTITHKRKPASGAPIDTTRYKIRIETETAVADGTALVEILQQLGYVPVFVYEKFRSEWSHSIDPETETPDEASRGHLVLDETPIGTWAELEGPTDWIDRTLAELNIDPATCLTDSYGKLFIDWKQRNNSPVENLTFAEINAPALVSQ